MSSMTDYAGLLLAFFGSMFQQNTYGTELENYISSNNPQNNGDVERLEVEFQQKAMKNRFPY